MSACSDYLKLVISKWLQDCSTAWTIYPVLSYTLSAAGTLPSNSILGYPPHFTQPPIWLSFPLSNQHPLLEMRICCLFYNKDFLKTTFNSVLTCTWPPSQLKASNPNFVLKVSSPRTNCRPIPQMTGLHTTCCIQQETQGHNSCR